jgi:hypothetical protein
MVTPVGVYDLRISPDGVHEARVGDNRALSIGFRAGEAR